MLKIVFVIIFACGLYGALSLIGALHSAAFTVGTTAVSWTFFLTVLVAFFAMIKVSVKS